MPVFRNRQHYRFDHFLDSGAIAVPPAVTGVLLGSCFNTMAYRASHHSQITL